VLSCLLISTAAPGEASSAVTTPAPEVFAPGVISGPANDGSPTFSPDGNTLFFTRSAARWTVILESHRINGQWGQPKLASFSGEWPDSSPAMSPDGSFIVFQSTRPKVPLTDATRPKPGQPIPGIISNLWRVDRTASGWSEPHRLPDEVNIPGLSIWKPSIAADGTVYLTGIDAKGNKRLYASRLIGGTYQPAEPLSFSDGTKLDVDPEIVPDGTFLVFCSSGRVSGDTRDHLFMVHRTADGWGPVLPIHYADEANGNNDDEPHLGSDHRTLYFSSDRVVPVHFPRTHEQAKKDLDRLNSWDNSNSNVWSIQLPA
jgi:Tol biopolymer transport system component